MSEDTLRSATERSATDQRGARDHHHRYQRRRGHRRGRRGDRAGRGPGRGQGRDPGHQPHRTGRRPGRQPAGSPQRRPRLRRRPGGPNLFLHHGVCRGLDTIPAPRRPGRPLSHHRPIAPSTLRQMAPID